MKGPIPFGKYYLLERINVGGMAEVFRAKAFGVEGFERLLAVKRILPNIAEDEEFIEMFIDEAKIAVQLNHANIAQIFDLGKVEDSYFIALEYVHGKDLRAIFDRCRSLTSTMPIAQACLIVMKVCEGLDYAHNKRDGAGREMHLVHRDVSPQNILISYEGEVKLVDFGIAKAAGKASKTQRGILKGKFGYMSPEQVRGLPLDRRSDIFSVGIVLYEMITGERLFLGESDFSTLEKVRNVEILPPSTYNRNVTEELEQIVLKALARDVDDRYQNAIDLHDDLQAYMYTSGEFYARKDLAGWMKRTFTREIEEEDSKLEAYRDLPMPEMPSAAGGPPPLPPPASTLPGRKSAVAPAASADAFGGATPTPTPGLAWEEDEVETQIYDKPTGEEMLFPQMPSTGAAPSVAADEADQPTPPIGVPSAVTRPPTSTAMVTPLPEARIQRRSRGGLWVVLSVVALALIGGGIAFYLLYLNAPGALVVITSPAGALIEINGDRQRTPAPLTLERLPPGDYHVVARKPGYTPWSRTVRVDARRRLQLKPSLLPLPMATIEVRSSPSGAKVVLDGRPLPTLTPMKISRVLPGNHRLEVRGDDRYHVWSQDLAIKSGQRLALRPLLVPKQVEVVINSQPKAVATLIAGSDRHMLGRTPLRVKLNLQQAKELELTAGGYQPLRQPLVYAGTQPIQIAARLTKAAAATTPIAKQRVVSDAERARLAAAARARAEQARAAAQARQAEQRRERARAEAARREEERRERERAAAEAARRERQAAAAKPKGNGLLMVNSKPWTQIVVDGKDTGLVTPQARITLPVGSHRITLRNKKFDIDQTFTVFIRAEKPTKLIRNFLN
ncbi:MAG: protein kinase [Deltaproteobacteria bacterium]|nr:protein kinase [Deltaproteobacteria bacterium]